MAPKSNPKAIAVPPKQTEAIVEQDWEKQLGAQAKNEQATFQSGTPRIQIDSFKFKVDGKDVGSELVGVVVEVAWAKEYYDKPYVPGVAATPICYAFGRSEKGLSAHPASPEPVNKQADGTSPCDSCHFNKFGTANVGKGKMCKDKPRLMILLQHDAKDEATAKKASCYMLSIPPTSLRNISSYLEFIKDATPHANIREAFTKVKVQCKPGTTYYELLFEFAGLVPKTVMPAIIARGPSAYSQLTQPFPSLEAAEVPDTKAVKGQAQKGRR